MEKKLAKDFVEIGRLLGLIQLEIGAGGSEDSAEEKAHRKQLQEDDLEELGAHCWALEMKISSRALEAAKEAGLQTEREFHLLRSVIEAEWQSKYLFYIPEERARYFENDRLLSDPARRAFPTAFRELREAATCYAVERYTGAVLHCCRALEVGIKAMCRHLGHTPHDLDQQDWHPLLLKCEALINDLHALKRGPDKEKELRFLSQAAKQFRYFKDADRIQAAHLRPLYRQGDAKEIVDATVSFYEALAKHLAENPTGPRP